jgi:hypothetical protein
MKSRQKKKNVNHDGEVIPTRSELIGRSLSHLNRSLRQFSEGLQTRIFTLQERVVIEPLESAAWVISQRVRKVQSRVFDFIDEKISMIEESRHRKLDHQTALERFDGEGGAMLPTGCDEEVPARETVAAKTPAESRPKSVRPFEPSMQH